MAALKHHHIRFKKSPEGSAPWEWESMLKTIDGVELVTVDAAAGDIFIEYDLLKCREDVIERRLVEEGFVLDDSFMQRFKRGWIHLTEENEINAFGSGKPAFYDYEGLEKKRKKMPREEALTCVSKEGAMEIDPVCKMTVSEEMVSEKVEYKGKDYYFCGRGCRERFEKDPDKYLAGERPDWVKE